MAMTRTLLPPISSFASMMPVISLELPLISESNTTKTDDSNKINCFPWSLNINNNNGNNLQSTVNDESTEDDISMEKKDDSSSPSSARSKIRPAQFNIYEDLAIVKCVFAYYKLSWNQKIPWSFWQVYRKTTGSQRSNSSLYHHWEGSICKKYAVFLNNGRLQDCINFIEAQIQMEKGNSSMATPMTASMGGKIQMGTPLSSCRAQTQVFQETARPQPLMRNFSMPGFAVAQPPYFQPMFY